MFIPEFWVGVGTTLIVEVVVIIIAAISISKSTKVTTNITKQNTTKQEVATDESHRM